MSLLCLQPMQVFTARSAVGELLAVQFAQSADAGTGEQCEEELIADDCAVLPAPPAGICTGSHHLYAALPEIAMGWGSCATSLQLITKPTALSPLHTEGSYVSFSYSATKSTVELVAVCRLQLLPGSHKLPVVCLLQHKAQCKLQMLEAHE